MEFIGKWKIKTFVCVTPDGMDMLSPDELPESEEYNEYRIMCRSIFDFNEDGTIYQLLTPEDFALLDTGEELRLHDGMAIIEEHPWKKDEEHLNDFLDRYTTPFDCSARALMFDRYLRRGDAEKFEPERRYQLFSAFDILLGTQYLMKWGEGGEYKHAVDEFIEDMLALIRRDAADECPDMWVDYRIDLALKSAARSLSSGDRERALAQTEAAVRLLEDTMAITDDILLPTSCRFLDGMEWHAAERFCTPDNNPDSSEERMIDIHTEMRGVSNCYLIAPSRYYGRLCGDSFAELRGDPEYVKLRERVKALIKVKSKEE